eukprot:UN2636
MPPSSRLPDVQGVTTGDRERVGGKGGAGVHEPGFGIKASDLILRYHAVPVDVPQPQQHAAVVAHVDRASSINGRAAKRWRHASCPMPDILQALEKALPVASSCTVRPLQAVLPLLIACLGVQRQDLGLEGADRDERALPVGLDHEDGQTSSEGEAHKEPSQQHHPSAAAEADEAPNI